MALSVSTQPEQGNVVANPDMGLVFFQSQGLCFNYKTNQWTRLSHMAGKRIFAVQGTDRVVGTVEEDSGNLGDVMIQDSQTTNASTRQGTFETGDYEIDAGFKTTVNAAMPVGSAASLSTAVRIGTKDLLTDSVTYATGSAANTRSGFHHFRGGANPPTGRYVRVRYIFADGFTTMSGSYVEFYRAGEL